MNLQDLIVKTKPFKARQLFIWLFCIAIIVRIIEDICSRRIGIHTGDIFRTRNMFSVEVYGLKMLFFEWFLAVVGVFLLIYDNLKFGAALVTLSFVLSLMQTFQNQKALIIVIAAALFFEAMSGRQKIHKISLSFLKWQFFLIYFFSAINKIFLNFQSGESLKNIFTYVVNTNQPDGYHVWAANLALLVDLRWLSWATICTELLIPLLIIKKPKGAFIVVMILHISFAAVIPDVWSFTLAMLALAALFLEKNETISSHS